MKKKGTPKPQGLRINQRASPNRHSHPLNFRDHSGSHGKTNEDVLIGAACAPGGIMATYFKNNQTGSGAADSVNNDYLDDNQKENYNSRQRRRSSGYRSGSSSSKKHIISINKSRSSGKSKQRQRQSLSSSNPLLKPNENSASERSYSAGKDWQAESDKAARQTAGYGMSKRSSYSRSGVDSTNQQAIVGSSQTQSQKLILTNSSSSVPHQYSNSQAVEAYQNNRAHDRSQEQNLSNESNSKTRQQKHVVMQNGNTKGDLNKQSSLKKFDSKLYQHSYTKVFVMGDTKFGQLGFLNPNEGNQNLTEEQRNSPVIHVPKMCSYNILVKQIACGEAHTHLLSQDGYVYSMGSNQYGVLGLGKGDDTLKAVTMPQLIPQLQCIVQIASGRAHTVALDVTREVYGWGRSDNGAIGLRMATPMHQSQPMVMGLNLDTKDQVIQIDCGLEHTCFLTADGHVFGCGEGEYGQLGVGYVTVKEYRPMRAKFTEMAAGDYVFKIACGAHHTAYLTRFKQVYVTGANNLGQLGIDSLDSQVNNPTLVQYLSDKSVQDIACGESSFAITSKGELFIWGLYNLEIHRKPFLCAGINRPVATVSQSFYGVTSAIDIDEQAWYWFSQLEAKTQNLMRLTPYPFVAKQMRKRVIKKVWAGKDLVFALGDDVHTNNSSSTVKDSQLTGSKSALQKIPEKESAPTSKTHTHHSQQAMPTLNLTKIHKDSTISLVNRPNGSIEKQMSMSGGSHKVKSPKSKSNTLSRSRSISKSAKKTRFSNNINRSTSGSVSKKRMQKRVKKMPLSPSDRSPRTSIHQKLTGARRHNKPQRGKSGTRSASQPNSEKNQGYRVTSLSKSRNASSIRKARSRSNSCHKNVINKQDHKMAPKAQNASMIKSQKSSKSVGRPTRKRAAQTQLEKQVFQKFSDLSQRLELDKEEVVTRLAQLTNKVSKIQKQGSNMSISKRRKVKSKQSLNLTASPSDSRVNFKGTQQRIQSIGSDVRSGGYDMASEDPMIMTSQQQSRSNILVTDQQPGLESQTYENESRPNLNMFNQEIQEELNQISQPQLIYSPQGGDTVDIRSPVPEPRQPQAERLRVDVSDSPPPPHERSQGVSFQSQNYPVQQAKMQQFVDRPEPQRFNQDLGPPSRLQSPPVRPQTTANTQGPPIGYNNVRSPKNRVISPKNRVKSPKNCGAVSQQPSYEQQLINQLREQIDYLERQTKRLTEEKLQEQMRAQDYCNRFEESRKSAMRVDVATEGNLRSLESQLRTSKIEKQDLAIKNADCERRIRDLEAKVIDMGAAKNKEQDYLDKLGKTAENLRHEKTKNKDLQNQNEMLQSTLTILETTIEQVKRDKEIIESEKMQLKEHLQARDSENMQLREHLQARNIEAEANRQDQMIGRQVEDFGHQTPKEMVDRSVQFDMRRCESRDKNSRSQRRGSNSSLVDKQIERSNERRPNSRSQRPSSQLSASGPAEFNLLNQQNVSQHEPEFADERAHDTENGYASQGAALRLKSPVTESAEQEYYTVNPMPCEQPDRQIQSHAFQTKESRETGHFEEPLTTQQRDAIYVEGNHDSKEVNSGRDPRIQRLLEDAKLLQDKHKVLMSQSPLRVKETSAERLGIRKSQSPDRHHTDPLQGAQAIREATERAKMMSYQNLTDSQTQHDLQHRAPSNDFNSQSAIYTRDRSPLCQLRDNSGPTLQAFSRQQDPSHNKSSHHERVPSEALYEQPPPSNSSTIHPYYQPPSMPNESVHPSYYQQSETSPLKEVQPQIIEEEPEEYQSVHVDPTGNQIRQSAGLPYKEKSHSPLRSRPDSSERSKPTLKGLLKNAFPREPAIFVPDNYDGLSLGPQSKSDGGLGRQPHRHDNQDYKNRQRDEKEREEQGTRTPQKEKIPIDKQKLAEDYNKKLLDNIEKLAQKARKDNSAEPRVNKFKRAKTPKSTSDKSRPGSEVISPPPNLPKSIFEKDDRENSREAYNDKLRQIPRPLTNVGTADYPVDTQPTKRVPSNHSAKRPRRPLSKAEDDAETANMVNKPGKPAGNKWNSGLFSGNNTAEKEKPSAENNSFLAKREALQNRLKKI